MKQTNDNDIAIKTCKLKKETEHILLQCLMGLSRANCYFFPFVNPLGAKINDFCEKPLREAHMFEMNQ